jgi:hypothetical protein
MLYARRLIPIMIIVVISGIMSASAARSAEPTTVKFDSYNGYFVSNQFEPNAKESFVICTNQEAFDKCFGVAFVMGDKSHRLPKDVFETQQVISAIKRGSSIWDYAVKEVVETNDEIEIHYSAKEIKQPSATFSSPMIVSIPKKSYKSISFVENGKVVKALKP